MPDQAAPPTVAVTLPAALVSLFPGATRRVELPAATVAEAIAALDVRWPGMRDRLCEPSRRLRRHVNVFVAGERAGPATSLAPGAEVVIMMALVGG